MVAFIGTATRLSLSGPNDRHLKLLVGTLSVVSASKMPIESSGLCTSRYATYDIEEPTEHWSERW